MLMLHRCTCIMAVYPSKITVFFLGFAIGVIIAFITVVSKNKFGPLKVISSSGYVINKDIETYDLWVTKLGYTRIPVNFNYFSFSGNKSLTQYLEFQLLKSKINVVCVMFIRNTNNAYAAMNTWMRHCNKIKFYSTKSEKYLDVTVLRPKNSWHYLCDVIRHVHDSFKDYMWVLFVPDDVFAIPENLRRYVFSMNFEAPYYLGHSGLFWNEQYNLAQAGYVLSKGSIIALTKKFPSSESCQKGGKYWRNEDFYLGKHLSELGITPSDTKDDFGRGRFHLFTPAQMLAPGDESIFKKYWKTSLHPVMQGFNCCSPHSITFQGTHKTLMYFYYYLLYNVHLHREAGHLGNIKSMSYNDSDQVWQQFVLDELGPHATLSSITPDKYYNLWRDKIDSPSIFNKRLRELFLGTSDD